MTIPMVTLLLPDDATAQKWYASMRAKWPMLPATARFDIAPTNGPSAALNDGAAVFTTSGFDDVHNMVHEIGHIIQELAERLRDPQIPSALDGTVGPDFITARRLPWPYRGPNTVPAPQWVDLGYEQFAEAFVRVNMPSEQERTTSGLRNPDGTEQFPWPGDDAMRAFFVGLFPAVAPAPAPAPVPTPTPAPVTPTATLRAMFDSTNPADIPAGPEMVAGYIDGLYRWPDAAWDTFPGSVKVRIAINVNTRDGHVGDVEWGDMTNEQAPVWCHNRRADGCAHPTIYTSANNVPALLAAFDAVGEPYPLLWVAHYGAEPIIPTIAGATVVALQYANEAITGGHYDLSVVAPHWPGVEGDEMPTDADILAAVNREVGRILGDPAFTIQDTVKAIKAQETKEVVALRDAAATLTKEIA